jgi:hypothetical protein
VQVPIGGRIITKDETMSYIGILFHGELTASTPPDTNDILGVEKLETLQTGSIIDDEKLFYSSTKNNNDDQFMNLAMAPANPANPMLTTMSESTDKEKRIEEEGQEREQGQEEEEEDDDDDDDNDPIILRTQNITVSENTTFNTDYAIMGTIPLIKLNEHPELKAIVLRGCCVNVIEKLKARHLSSFAKKKRKDKKVKGKKGKKGKKNKLADEPIIKDRTLSFDVDDYDHINADEVMYRVWVHRARHNSDLGYLNKEEAIVPAPRPRANHVDEIDEKYFKRKVYRQKKRDDQHWDDIMIQRELNALRKFKSASVTLMKDVKTSFQPLHKTIHTASQVKTLSTKILKKARDHIKEEHDDTDE